jgi:hypothetical protein
MDTPSRTPVETKLANFRTVKLTVGAAIVALVAVVGDQCNALVKNFHNDGGATVSDAATNDDETSADGGEPTEPEIGEGTELKSSIGTPDKAEALRKFKAEFIAGRMSALINALLSLYPPLPEPDKPNGRYSDELRESLQGHIFIKTGKTMDERETLTISGGKNGYVQDFVGVFYYQNSPDDGKRFLSIVPIEGTAEHWPGALMPSSGNDADVVLQYASILNDYTQRYAEMKKATREYDSSEREQPDMDLFVARTGYQYYDNPDCRLTETTRAFLEQCVNDVGGGLYKRLAEYMQEDRGDEVCGR